MLIMFKNLINGNSFTIGTNTLTAKLVNHFASVECKKIKLYVPTRSVHFNEYLLKRNKYIKVINDHYDKHDDDTIKLENFNLRKK